MSVSKKPPIRWDWIERTLFPQSQPPKPVKIDDHEKKYYLVPGKMISENDGQEHYVGVKDLVNLYGVPLRQCIVIHEDDPHTWIHHTLPLPILRPRYHYEDYRKFRLTNGDN